MVAKQLSAEETLRAWADAFNAAADLQHEIIAIAADLTPMEDRLKLQPFREAVFGTFATLVDRTAVQKVQQKVMKALVELREEAENHKKA